MLVGPIDHALEQRFPGFGVLDGFELPAKAQTHSAFETHSPELTAGPCHREDRGPEAASRHRLRTKSVTLAEHDGEERDGQARPDDEQPAEVTDLAGLLGLRAHHEPRCVAQEEDREVMGVT